MILFVGIFSIINCIFKMRVAIISMSLETSIGKMPSCCLYQVVENWQIKHSVTSRKQVAQTFQKLKMSNIDGY